MRRNAMITRVAAGAVAGMAGTAVIQGLQVAGQKAMPEEMPPIREHPGEFMVKKAEELLPAAAREKIPPAVETGVAHMLGFGYGMTFGVLCALLHRKKYNLMLEGTVLGVAAWGAGYLGWLPATGLMPPVTRQKPGQVAGEIASHLAYGVATAGLLKLMRQKRWVGA